MTVAPSSSAAPDVPELIPVRMLNEFAYCPRLAYLEWIQGEFQDNLETQQGAFAHRNVDQASRKEFHVPGQPQQSSEGGGKVRFWSNAVQSAEKKEGGRMNDEDVNQTHGPTDPRTHRPHERGRMKDEDVNSDRLEEADSNPQPADSGAGDTDPRPQPSDLRLATCDSGLSPSDSIHARSLMLSATGEGLIAKLDLLEIDGQTATPVDYKRGNVPDTPLGVWEPERVQLCAQGLILRENGFQCQEGVIYYVASRRRVKVVFDEALVARTRQLVVELREMAAGGKIPPPLEDSPKCPRCSLVGICLPDETNLLRVEEESKVEKSNVEKSQAAPSAREESAPPRDKRPAGKPRRLLPARDDALPLYVLTQGAVVGKSGAVLTIKERGKLVRSVKLKDVSQVCLFGNVQPTAAAVGELAARGTPICHFSYGGWFRAVTMGLAHKNVELRIAQFARAADAAGSLDLAKRFVVGKIKNCRTLLRRHAASRRTRPKPEWGQSSNDQRRDLNRLAELVQRAEKADCAESLLGVEGMAAKIYFAGFGELLKAKGEVFEVEGRNRRPPKDPVNALLSFVYALLVKELTITAQAVGLDPMLGFYHRPRYGRPSLALDLAEEFRPLIGDSVVMMLINNGEVSESSFVRRAGSVAMTDAGRRAVLSAFERRMDSEVTHPLFGYRISYRRILEVQVRLLARTLLGEVAEYPNFCTR